ncbi:MAG: HAMP domain-containing histidine kinase [Tannerella sp.]|jgi:signal transduction histidine kinase|nr:HAMP domain-containing histidine kinase [Tannerella sp.]
MQIGQVLINLIKNAWEASCRNEQPAVNVTVGLDNFQRPQITVSDNGEGILPDVHKRIFIPFFTTKKNGSGIGLSICKQIVGAHGGNISVTSIPNEGSRFTIRL